MKRHFLTGLKAFAVSALAFAAVSCYDDSELWGELEGLEQRVAALEEKLNSEVATLNSKIGAVETAYKAADADLLKKLTDLDAKLVSEIAKLVGDLDAADGILDGLVTTDDLAAEIKKLTDAANAKYAELAGVDKEILAALTKVAVTKVEKNAAGNAVLTFLDGTTLEVGAADANANNTGLVTVVDGKWAVIGADGKTTVLDAEVHPDTELKFKVDSDTNELLVSYDGKTWEQTGVIVNDDTTINVVTGFKEAADYVTITVGDKEYLLPKYVADNSELTLGREKAFMTYGATKTLELKAEGIKEYYVMSKPDGWKASIEGTVLSVTAPSEELTELGAGELKGEILIHATADNGNCKVAKLAVETGAPFSLTYKDGDVTIFNTLTSETTLEDGSVAPEFLTVYLGIVDVDFYNSFATEKEFFEEAIYLETINPYLVGFQNDLGDFYYLEGVREEQSLTMAIDDIASYLDYTLEEDVDYVIFALPIKNAPLYDEGKVAFTAPYFDVKFTNIVYNNADVTISAIGAESYIVGATSKTAIDNLAEEMAGVMEWNFESYLQYGPNFMQGPWTSFLGGDSSAMGKMLSGELSELKLNELLVDYGATVEGETEYYVWILPYTEGRSHEDYATSELIVKTCTTADLTYNSELAAEVSVTGQFYKIDYNFNVPEGAVTYYYFYTKSFYDNLEDGYDFKTDLKNKCENPAEGNESGSYTYSVNPGTQYVLVTYTVGGPEYGDVKTQNVNTPAIPYDDDSSMAVTLESVKIDGTNYVATFNVIGATHVMGYNVIYKDSYSSTYLKNILSKPGTYPSYLWGAVEDGKVEFTFTGYPSKKDFVVWAYNANEGAVTELQSAPFVAKDFAAALTLDKKQWVFNSPAIDKFAFADPDDPSAELPTGPCVFDLGVAFTPEAYPNFLEEATWVLANDWKNFLEDEESSWLPVASGNSAYTITPSSSNISSGNIVLNVGDVTLNIPYSNFTGTTCTFDFAELFDGYGIEGDSVVNATISEEVIEITNYDWL